MVKHGKANNKLKFTSNFDEVSRGNPPISDGIGRFVVYWVCQRNIQGVSRPVPPPQKKKRVTSMALPCPSQVETRHHMDMRFEVSCSRIARLFHVAWLQGQAIHLYTLGITWLENQPYFNDFPSNHWLRAFPSSRWIFATSGRWNRW